MTSLQAQCDLDFSFANTGTNMTAFFTPPAASAIYAELGDGTLGAFFINNDEYENIIVKFVFILIILVYVLFNIGTCFVFVYFDVGNLFSYSGQVSLANTHI